MGQVRVSILVRSVKQEQTHMCILIQCMINVHWVAGRFARCRQEIRPRKDTDWLQHWLEALNSCIILSSQEIQAQGSCLTPFMLSLILAQLSLNVPSPKDQYSPQSLAHTCEIPSLLFLQLSVQKMLCSNHPIGFTNAVWKIQAEPLLSQMVGNLVLQVILFFKKSQFQDHSAWLYRVGREGWVETIFPTPTSRETSSFPWKAPAPQQTNNKYSFTKMISLTSVSNTLYTILV